MKIYEDDNKFKFKQNNNVNLEEENVDFQTLNENNNGNNETVQHNLEDIKDMYQGEIKVIDNEIKNVKELKNKNEEKVDSLSNNIKNKINQNINNTDKYNLLGDIRNNENSLKELNGNVTNLEAGKTKVLEKVSVLETK